MEREKIVSEALGIIRRYLPDKELKVFLFGSWAKGSAEPTSDIDIAILGAQPIDEMLLLRLREEISGIPTLRRIDVVDLNNTDERFREEVLSYARPL
ncbi:MAG: nucleotidyltransferase domain-containing protein [Acidobacteriia bacterium]|nr:nucleotidyltransferase domain-containing protein [Terriglobia bacterium]